MDKVNDDIRVTVRVNRVLKESADVLFEKLGLNMTTAMNVFLRKAVDENAIPFTVSAKSGELKTSMASDDISNTFIYPVNEDINQKAKNGYPVARYDKVQKRAYLEYPDGTKEYSTE